MLQVVLHQTSDFINFPLLQERGKLVVEGLYGNVQGRRASSGSLGVKLNKFSASLIAVSDVRRHLKHTLAKYWVPKCSKSLTVRKPDF